jgi:hypothetical protein
MLIVGTVLTAVLVVGGLSMRRWRARATVLAFVTALIALLAPAGTAGAAVVATVPLGTASSFAVLGASEVTNSGATTLDGDLGLSPGPAISGFPPGLVLAPWTTYETTAEAASAQAALGTAYTNAATRSVDNDIVAELNGLTLIPGVTAGPGGGALLNSGNLIFDGQGLTDPVFIIQAAELTTAVNSTMSLINGADACNIYWQIGSSATIGGGSTFQGTIMALAAVTVGSEATIHGRALARTAAVTLIDDTFTSSACTADETTTTTTTTEAATTESTEVPTTETPTTDVTPTSETATTAAPPLGPTLPQGPAIPQSPTVPEGPSIPRGPSVPESPTVPESPDVPENPDLPEYPDVPENPDVPDAPGSPDGPGVPGVSAPPQTGGAPAPLDLPAGKGRGLAALFGAAGCVGLTLTATGRSKGRSTPSA